MGIRVLPLVAALAPLFAINVAYWLGALHDHLPTCNPYLDGCTSISSTGRYPPGDRLFRAVMLPQAALLAVTWYFAALWMRVRRPDGSAHKIVLFAGPISALALVVYISYLASNDPFYEVMKTYGIYFYFVGTALCQVVVSLSLEPSRLRQAMLVLCGTPFALGILNFVQKALLTDINSIENRIEWLASLLLQLWFVALYVAWRRTRFTIRAQTG